MVMIGNPMRLSWVIVPSIGLRGVFQYCVTSQGQTYWTTTLSWDERVIVVRDNYWRDNYWTADMMAAIWVRCNYNIKWYVITPKVYARRHCYSLQCYVPRWPNMTLKQFIRPIDYSRRNEESSDRIVLSHQVIITTRNVLYKSSRDSVVDTESDTARTGWHINPTWRNQSVLLGHTSWERESNSNKDGSNYSSESYVEAVGVNRWRSRWDYKCNRPEPIASWGLCWFG